MLYLFSLSEIGPFCTRAGINKQHFKDMAGDAADLPTLSTIANGTVIELYDHLYVKCKMSLYAIAKILCKLTDSHVDEKKIIGYVNALITKRKKMKRDLKGQVREVKLVELRQGDFTLMRGKAPRTPDTPRKKKLRAELATVKAKSRGMKRKLAARETESEELKETVLEQKEHLRSLETVLEAQKVKEKDLKEKEKDLIDLSSQLKELQSRHNILLDDMAKLTAEFDPARHELKVYKKKYADKEKDMVRLEKALNSCQNKLQKTNPRNVNKKLKRREENLDKLKKEHAKLKTVVQELQEEHHLSKDQLTRARAEIEAFKQDVHETSDSKRKLYKQAWYQKKQRERHSSGMSEELESLQERVKFLERREKELQELIDLMEDDSIMTFEEGRYNDCIRQTIMELLAQNVSMNKVSSVIRTVIKNLAGKCLDRLPSIGTVSKLALEANHLASIEVALAMERADPQEAVGNCIHGDGTTKHHRKFQNFQVTLPDGTSRTLGMMEMAAGDTDAVVEAFKERLQCIAAALGEVHQHDQEKIYKDLVTTVKSTMTDQGATMPQFNERLSALRQDLLPEVVEHWDQLPEDVRSCMSDFGKFFCKMHPLINFAEEVDKVLKSFEDISTAGKHAHTLQTSESGVTRLIRIASKAFHHRGCDKSGVEDVFSSYLTNACGTTNHLVDFIGNRANIIFEGAASLYLHIPHITDFLSMLQNKNNLLLAVEEDTNEKIFVAELRALGLFYISAIKPLWNIIKSASNIFATNAPLHQFQLKLLEWKDDASSLLTGDSPFQTDTSDEVAQKLLTPCDAESESMTIQALELISCAVLLILQRQCKDQLPGGKYWDPSPEMEGAYKNVPSTNMIGERDFAQLDLLIRKKPSARITTLETIIMWTNNKTPEWLDSLTQEQRSQYMTAARQCSDDVLAKYVERKKKIKEKKWENLQKSHQKKKELEEKKMKSTATLVNEVVELGGVWTTEHQILDKVSALEKSKTDEQMRRIIYTQLCFMQKVLKCQGPKELFQLTHQGKPYSKQEMTTHLVNVVAHNNLDTNPPIDPLSVTTTQESSTSTLEYTESTEQAASFQEQKEKLWKKIEEEKRKRAACTSKQNLQKFLERPELLVGKRIEHLFIIDQMKVWVHGMVTGISSKKNDNLKTLFTIDYEDEQELKEYNLLKDLKKNELIVLKD